MSEITITDPAAPARNASSLTATAWYLYGIVPAASGPLPTGPEAGVTVVPYRRIAALVRPLPGQSVRPSRRDLLGHAQVLDRTAETSPVLPMRFGTVLPSSEAVTREVLAPHHDRFAAALDQLTGRAQFTLRASYLPEVALREALATEPRAVRLHRQLRDRPPDGDTGARIRLGELVARAAAGKRAADAAALTEALRPHVVAARVQVSESADLDQIAEVGCLVESRHRQRFESTAERLARDWHGRIRLRLRGPMAPYHFVDELVDQLPAGR